MLRILKETIIVHRSMQNSHVIAVIILIWRKKNTGLVLQIGNICYQNKPETKIKLEKYET